MAPFLELKHVSVGFGPPSNRTEVLHNLNLSVDENEFVAIIGFSGSGKSTLISLLAGLTAPDEGEVLMRGWPAGAPGPHRGIMFQNYSLLPWLSVFGNIELAVKHAFPKMGKQARKPYVEHYIELVNLTAAAWKKPRELSGGMRQRVSLARTLAMQPEVLLLDEPLSALDAITRATLQDELVKIWEQDKRTVIMVTNDVDEGVLIADRIIPLNPGPQADLGPSYPVDLERPRNRAEINQNRAFIDLRRAINTYLDQVNAKKNQLSATGDVKLPALASREARAVYSPHTYIELVNVNKTYPTPKGPAVVVDGFNLRIAQNEVVALLGHSGCGKSTVLSMLAGLNEITRGNILVDNREIDGPGTDRGMVFQSPSLLPWMTAYGNVMLGVAQAFPGLPAAQRDQIVHYYLARVGLTDAADKYPRELSQGMCQRVGLARAFALDPKVLLLDEPFGMLDSLTRHELQDVLIELLARNEKTALMVTHDVDEAIFLADRVVMMTNGPAASVGEILDIKLPRPRHRLDVMNHPDYYGYREQMLDFLAHQDELFTDEASGPLTARLAS